jgi:hypothetical protein
MEVQSLIAKVQRLPAKFDEALKKDLLQIVSDMMKHFDIHKRGTSTLITSDELDDIIQHRFFDSKNNLDDFCMAVTASNSRCTRRPQHNSKYCKTHWAKSIVTSMHEANSSQPIIMFDQVHNDDCDEETMQTQFIDNSFYFVDDKHIYDMETRQKVGYISLENDEQQFILTSDPFILDVWNEKSN